MTPLLLLAVGLLLGFAGFAVISLREHEQRAATIAVVAAVVTPLPLVLACLLPAPARLAILAALAILTAAAVVLWLLPVGRVQDSGQPTARVDERDTMFARARLQPGSDRSDTYYRMRPEYRQGDDRSRALPGLLSLAADKADPVCFAAAEASFAITEAQRDMVDGPVAVSRSSYTPEQLTTLVKRLARYWGAVSVGVTELQPYHLYSHVGRGTGTWGEPITCEHTRAVAFSVEMDHQVMASAPEASVVMESARRYVEAAGIALQLAGTLRGLGYPARAHIDGNYRVIAPLVARDAGLGEIGRIGLLMTPQLGPRVRLGVVTCSAPLHCDPPGFDRSVIDFCTICKKCADCCPTASIPFADREPVGESGLRWRIDADTCFRYWCTIGSDCGRCLRVCPYSHPDTTAHNLVRWAIRSSGVARRVLLWADDLFYGRKPAIRPYSG